MLTVFTPAGILSEKRPSMSVTVPTLFFSLHTSPAPMTASPSGSTTLPEKVLSWAYIQKAETRIPANVTIILMHLLAILQK